MYPGQLVPGVLTGFYQCENDEHGLHDVLMVGHPAELIIAAKMMTGGGTDITGPDTETGAVEFRSKDEGNATYLVMKPAQAAVNFIKGAGGSSLGF